MKPAPGGGKLGHRLPLLRFQRTALDVETQAWIPDGREPKLPCADAVPALMKGTNSRYTQTLKERPFPSKRGMSYPPMSCRAICGRELACPSMDTALCVRI